MTLETFLIVFGLLAEAAALALAVYRKVYKTLPLFSCYLAWGLVSDAGVSLLTRHFPDSAVPGLQIYFVNAIIDSVFMFCVLIELSMSVLRPVRGMLSKWTIPAVALALALSCAVIWPFAKSPGLEQTAQQYQIIVHLQLTISVMRILYFVVLAAGSQFLSIGWRDRELQVATGFGFYALASLSVALFHMNQGPGGPGNPALDHQFHILDQMVAASYVCSMVYWSVSFLQKVPERREFTPQMQSLLLAVAGNARTARVAMRGSLEPKATHNKDR